MSKSRRIRSALKKILEPQLDAEGFVGRYPNFQRREDEWLDLLSVIYDKWGGGFVLEFARHEPGPLKTSWGAVIEESEIDVAYVSPEKRARLVSTGSGQGMYEDFFRYDGIEDDKEACEALASTVVQLFPQVNEWLREAKTGENIAAFA